MEEEPKNPKEWTTLSPNESFPENASLEDIGSKSSVWREFWIGCHNQFWKWYGLEEVGKDLAAHSAAVKKAAALRFFCLVIIMTGAAVFELRGCVDEGSIRNLNGTVTQLNAQVTNLNLDKNTLQTLYNGDENALGPLRKIANEKFAQAPPDQRVGLLLKRMESLQNDLDSKLQSLPSAVITSKKIESLNTPLPSGSYETKVALVVENANEHTVIAWNCPFLVAKPDIKPTGSGLGFGVAFSAPFSTAEMTFITSAPIKESDLQISLGGLPASLAPNSSASPP